MLRINDKQFVFNATALMEPEQVATLTFPEIPGLTFKLQADKAGTPLTSVEDNFKQTLENNVITVFFPFLEGGQTISGDYTIETSAGNLGLLLGASTVGRFMEVQLHGFWTRP